MCLLQNLHIQHVKCALKLNPRMLHVLLFDLWGNRPMSASRISPRNEAALAVLQLAFGPDICHIDSGPLNVHETFDNLP